MVDPIFSGVLVVMSVGVVNPILRITMINFVVFLPRDSGYGLEFITTGIN